MVFGDLETTIVQKDRQVAAYEQVGWDFVHEAPYNILGEANWGPFVTALEQDGVEALTFVGEGQNMALLQQAMQEEGYQPEVIQLEANLYDPTYLEAAGSAAEGTFVRTAFWPHLRRRVPGQPGHGQVPRPHGGAGGQDRLARRPGDVRMAAVRPGGSGVRRRRHADPQLHPRRGDVGHRVDGGGLHAPTNPAENRGPECGILLRVEGGEFVRESPAAREEGENGFNCGDDFVVDVAGGG